MKKKEKFQSSDMTRITGVKLNRYQNWVAQVPSLKPTEPASGHGTRNVYYRKDLYRIALFKRLKERGFSRKSAGEIVSQIDFTFIDEDGKLNIGSVKTHPRKAKAPQPTNPSFIVLSSKRVKDKFEIDGVSEITPSVPKVVSGIKMQFSVVGSESATFPDDVIFINYSTLMKEIDEKIDERKG